MYRTPSPRPRTPFLPLTFLFLSLLGIWPPPAQGREYLKLGEIENLFIERNPMVKARQAELLPFDGRLQDARQRPNPTLNTSLESIANGSRENDATITLSQDFDWSGRRRLHIRSIEHQKRAHKHRLTFEFREELTHLKKTFCKILFLRKDVSALEQVLQTIETIEKAVRNRIREGDVAEIDLMRIRAERQKVHRLIETLRNEADMESRSVAVALGLASFPRELTLDRPFPRDRFDRDTLLAIALRNRADLQALQESILSAEASIRATRREIRFPVTLEVGYKSLSGGFNGVVLGVSTPLSISHQNQGRIRELSAERDAAKLRITADEQVLTDHLDRALERLAFLDARSTQLSQQQQEAKEILRIVQFSYDEGEVGLIELLDATRSESDLLLDINRTTLDTWSVLFDLESTIGIPLTGPTTITEGEST